MVASELAADGIHASFALDQAPSLSQRSWLGYGDQAIPLLPTGGLVRWLKTRDQLSDVSRAMGSGHHFLYASNGPSVGQWLFAHGAGGRLVAGAVRLQDRDDQVGSLHAGEVVELRPVSSNDSELLVARLAHALQTDHLSAVPVGRLLQDAGSPV